MKILLISVLCWLTSAVPAAADVIEDVFTILSRDYINEAENRDIALKGLQALQAADPDFRLSPSGEKLYLYYKRRLAKIFTLPASHVDSGEWAALSRRVIAGAAQISPEISRLDFEMPDRFAGAVFESLDGYSHYYGAFAATEDGKKLLRRNFAARTVGDVLLIKILSFQKDVSRQVAEAVGECSQCTGVILDLRGNHGGILDEALKITDMFLDEGIIAYTEGKEGEAPRFYTAAAGDVLDNKPLAVLVDGYSASAAEVLAAALSEQNRAVLIGTRTYGKGTVQDVVKMGNGRSMALTTAYFFTPAGVKIDKAGLLPAICTGGINSVEDLSNAGCERADRFNEESDVEAAVRYIKNEL